MKESYENKQRNIATRASSDAFEYVRHIRKESPEYLTIGPGGEPIINIASGIGFKLFSSVKKDLGLNEYEMLEYLGHLSETVKILLTGKK